MKARLGIAPIAWWNDDLPEISGDISLEGCLSEAREAGFTGMETGRRAAVLRVMANAGYTVED
jgi:inosose dehydratase